MNNIGWCMTKEIVWYETYFHAEFLLIFKIQNLPPVEDVVEDEWHQDPPDPSFCSGKFSARSTSFGGMNNTRDENFSDFSKVPSFQVF